MTQPYYEDDWVTLYGGEALSVLASLPTASVDAIVTDPPYLPLRCGVDHGWECCGCLDHPVGKPWGWNSSSWDEHWNQTTESEADE